MLQNKNNNYFQHAKHNMLTRLCIVKQFKDSINIHKHVA